MAHLGPRCDYLARLTMCVTHTFSRRFLYTLRKSVEHLFVKSPLGPKNAKPSSPMRGTLAKFLTCPRGNFAGARYLATSMRTKKHPGDGPGCSSPAASQKGC